MIPLLYECFQDPDECHECITCLPEKASFQGEGWNWGSFFWGLVGGTLVVGPIIWTATGRALAKEAVEKGREAIVSRLPERPQSPSGAKWYMGADGKWHEIK
jgi:hypothetical protein